MTKLLYTAETAAEALSCSTRQLSRYSNALWCAEHDLPVLPKRTLHGRPVFDADDLREWVKAATRGTGDVQEQIKAAALRSAS